MKRLRKERILKIVRVMSRFMSDDEIIMYEPEELEEMFYDLISQPVPIERVYLEEYYGDTGDTSEEDF